MNSVLVLGFLIGMRHALEADHLAAVATLSAQQNSLKRALQSGAAWGLGHSLTLFLFGSIVLLMNGIIPEKLAQSLEFLVGIMLLGLGFDVLRRLIRDKIHFHTHQHQDGKVHFHAHSHAGESSHNPTSHHHEHQTFPIRALLIGLMHGMAGSAALVLLTLETIQSPWLGLAYIALFGLGSVLGMAVLSVIIAIPLYHSAKKLTWLHHGLQISIGLMTMGLGSLIVQETWPF